MDASALKRKAAQEAVKLVKPHSTIGFGAGSTIAFFIEVLSEQIKQGLLVKVVTSSFKTKLLCLQKGIPLADISTLSEIDLYFDGCDQFDEQLNALKSGGGIHTREKLLASMAHEFILIGDEAKYVKKLGTQFPVVIDVMPEALAFVLKKVTEIDSGIKSEIRMSDKKDGAVITENGHVIVDLWLKEITDIEQLNHQIKAIPGVIETSLFLGIAQKAIIAGQGGIQIIEKRQVNNTISS